MLQLDAQGLVATFARAAQDLELAAQRALTEAASFALEDARRTNAFKDRTGDLRDSIRRVALGPLHQQVIAGGTSKVGYALFLEEGTRAHRIDPRNARALRFASGGSVRFAAHVSHPGTKGAHFMRDAAARAEADVEHFVERQLAPLFH